MSRKHHSPDPVPPQPAPVPVSPLDQGQLSPGGDDLPAYRWAFNAYVLLFLLMICFGLANYLLWYLKSRSV